jgi:uncharacterized tellurite resistance protein B-like protein
MTSPKSDLLQRAKQGDLQSITDLLNYLLHSKGLQAAASLKNDYLYIILQSDQSPAQETSVAYLRNLFEHLQLGFLKGIKIYGKRKSATFHAWNQELHFETSSPEKSSFWNVIVQQATGFGESIQNTTIEAGKIVSKTVLDTGETVEHSATQLSRSVAKTAEEWGELSNPLTQQVSRVIAETAIKTGETVSVTTTQVSQTIAGAVAKGQTTMNESFDLSNVSEVDRLAFYGALFAIATADEQLDKDEMELIFGMMDLENMSEEGKRQLQSYVIDPPSLWRCLEDLSDADEKLRFSLMVNLVDTAWANDEFDANEEEAIVLAQRKLKVTNEQLTAIKAFIQKIREIRTRGLDDTQAADAIKSAASGLAAVGVPIAAVYFSGSVIGLSAAGITSGLAALGLGFGMVPGIGIAVLVGAGIFMGISSLLDTGGNRAKEEERKKQERRFQLVIQNMHGAIGQITEKILDLQKKANSLEANAATAEANKEAIRILTERLKFMQQAVAKRKQSAGGI